MAKKLDHLIAHERGQRRAELKAVSKQWNELVQAQMIDGYTGEPEALPMEVIGSLDWFVCRVYGDKEGFIEYLAGLMACYDGQVDEDVKRFILRADEVRLHTIALRKRRKRRKVLIKINLNKIASETKVDIQKLLSWASTAFVAISKTVFEVMARGIAFEILETTRLAAQDLENGHKDRALIFKLAGFLPEGPLVNIQNSQQTLNVSTQNSEALRQFKETVIEIEKNVRSIDHREEKTESLSGHKGPLRLSEGMDIARVPDERSRGDEEFIGILKTREGNLKAGSNPGRETMGPMRGDLIED